MIGWSIRAQTPAPVVHVAVGFAVDTTSAPNQEIFDLWSAYLKSHPSCETPSPFWSPTERAGPLRGDLLCNQVYQGFTAFTVVNLEPAAGMDSTYFIRTLVGTVADSGTAYRPLALYRTYAVREAGHWVLANALPIETREWRHEQVGRITFVFPVTYPFSRARAVGAAQFVDSLAHAWSLDPPAAIGYYFTAHPKDTQRAMGLDFVPAPDTTWGLADTRSDLVFVGSSSSGEDYRHELAHLVLIPFVAAHHPSRAVNEGLATWTGGSAGLRFHALLPGLERFLHAHPDVTLAQILTDPPRREGSLDVEYDGFAALCQLVYAQGGLAAITALADAHNDHDALLDAAARAMGVQRSELDRAWRAGVKSLARQSP